MSRELDVAVNLLWLAPGRVGGSEEYLTRQLAGIDPASGCHPTLYSQRPLLDAHPELTARFPTVALPLGRDWRGTRVLAEHTWLAGTTRSADLVHHGGGTAPLVGRRPTVLTVHDLQYLAHPEYFGRARRAYLAAMVPRSVRRAAVVTAPSEFVRRSVIDAFGSDPARVVVVPHGVPEPVQPSADVVGAAVRRHGLADRPFVVYPAITHPHKGHRVLVEMVRRLPEPMALVLTGGRGAADADLEQAIEHHGVADRVVRTGRVSPVDRDALISAAVALVFPSEYEGFGAPLVEAMALATPVVASDAAAVREVVADAGVIVTERSGRAWAAGVEECLDRRAELVERGCVRREGYSLEAAGRALVGAYRLAADIGDRSGAVGS